MHADDGADNGDHGGIIDNDGSDPTQLSWWINRFTEITQTLARDLEEFPENPSASIALIQNDIPFLVADEISHVAKLQYKHVPAIAGASARSADRRAGSVGRLYRVWVGWLAGSRPQCPGVAVAPMPATSEPDRMPSGAPFRDRSGSAGCGSNGSLGTTGRSTPASAATPPAPPAAEVAGPAFRYVVGGPGVVFDSAMSASARRTASEPDQAAIPAATVAARARRRRRARLPDPGYRYEFLESESASDAEPFPCGMPVRVQRTPLLSTTVKLNRALRPESRS